MCGKTNADAEGNICALDIIRLASAADNRCRIFVNCFVTWRWSRQGASFSALPGAVFMILPRAWPLATSMTVTTSPVLS